MVAFTNKPTGSPVAFTGGAAGGGLNGVGLVGVVAVVVGVVGGMVVL